MAFKIWFLSRNLDFISHMKDYYRSQLILYCLANVNGVLHEYSPILQINDVWFEILQRGLLDTELLYLQA